MQNKIEIEKDSQNLNCFREILVGMQVYSASCKDDRIKDLVKDLSYFANKLGLTDF